MNFKISGKIFGKETEEIGIPKTRNKFIIKSFRQPTVNTLKGKFLRKGHCRILLIISTIEYSQLRTSVFLLLMENLSTFCKHQWLWALSCAGRNTILMKLFCGWNWQFNSWILSHYAPHKCADVHTFFKTIWKIFEKKKGGKFSLHSYRIPNPFHAKQTSLLNWKTKILNHRLQ